MSGGGTASPSGEAVAPGCWTSDNPAVWRRGNRFCSRPGMAFARGSATDVSTLAGAAVPLDDYLDGLIRRAADKPFVLLGEASHGTAEFYQIRARISRRLIEEHGFAGIVAEADWPEAFAVNRFVRGADDHAEAAAALSIFDHFPRWMWRNVEVAELADWLRCHNAGRPPGRPAGFYGMDLYALYRSLDAVLAYLRDRDPDAARRAADRYGCLMPYRPEPQRYGAASRFGEDCEADVVAQLRDMLAHAGDTARHDGVAEEDERFHAEQCARLAVNAERYYRAMYRGDEDTWNLRDGHMAETLGRLRDHLSRTLGRPAKLVVWAHNSHLGDARHTDMGDRGEHNVGQLAREQFGRDNVHIVGFTTHAGTVTAADDWGGRDRSKTVNPSLPDSLERLLHDAAERRGLAAFGLNPAADAAVREAVDRPRLQRMIGVIYRPDTERWSHYGTCRAASQYDELIHVDRTTALRPLASPARITDGAAETFPSGM